jgi:MFS family permease
MIEFQASAWKQTRGREYAVRFVVGGGITLAAALIAKAFGPVIGGLFLAFPAIFPASATLVAKHEEERKAKYGLHGHERGRKAAALDSRGAALGSLGLALFAVINWRLLSGHAAGFAFVTATLAWFSAAFLAWLAWKRRHRLLR